MLSKKGIAEEISAKLYFARHATTDIVIPLLYGDLLTGERNYIDDQEKAKNVLVEYLDNVIGVINFCEKHSKEGEEYPPNLKGFLEKEDYVGFLNRVYYIMATEIWLKAVMPDGISYDIPEAGLRHCRELLDWTRYYDLFSYSCYS